MCARVRFCVLLSVCCLSAPTGMMAANGNSADSVLKSIGVTRGICVLLADRQCALARALAAKSDLLLYVQLPSREEVAAASQAADAAGLFGTRIYVERGTPARIGLASNTADAVIVAADSAAPKAEILRVLRPGGKAIVGQDEWLKPFPEGIDDWSHHYHGPDNNPQSQDRLIRAPYLTQFVVEPRYAPAPQAAVASGGRVFMAYGHVAWHEREEPWMNTLVAIDGFNGTMLWKRSLTPGIMVDRCTMVATPSTLYLADARSCRLVDPATGKVRDEIAPPETVTKDTFWKWIALDNGLLYGLVGEQEPQDPDARWRRTAHGWPWSDMSRGYTDPKHLWGFGKTLVAFDAGTKQVLWSRHEDPPIDSRAMGLSSGRLFYTSFGRYVACVDAKTGSEIWRKTAEKDPEVFRAIGPYRPEQGPIQGWKTNVYLKCTEKAIYFVGPEVPWLTALAADDGHVLWRHPVKDLHLVVRDDCLVTIGPATAAEETKKLDPLTGKVLASFATRRRSCTRATGTADSIFFRGHEGSGRFDLASGKTAWISAMRPSCQVGVLVAHGHLYWVPWACDCDLQLFGAIACGPAGDFVFDQKATAEERLEPGSGRAGGVAPFAASPADWPTYRHDNARSARTPATVAEKARLLWQYRPPREVEPTAPVAAEGWVFFSGADGIVRALEAASGKPQWAAYTGGTVRYPPAIAEGRALVGAGDGWVYALEAATGQVLWRFRAAPAERKIHFYDGLLSTWPVASGVLVENGTAYCAAGINDFDGTHVYALDAATGGIRWQNNSSGHLDKFSARGVACQGELLLYGGRLYLAGGNTVSPGVYDAQSGRCLNAAPTTMGATAPRGRELVLAGGQVKTVGQPLYSLSSAPVFDPSIAWDNPVVTTANARLSCVEERGSSGRGWKIVAQSVQDGRRLWSHPLPAEPVRWAIAVDAQGRVVVALRSGQILCFGG